MPQNQSQLGHLLALLAQLQKSALPRVRIHHLRNPLQHPSVLVTDSAHSSSFTHAIALSLPTQATLSVVIVHAAARELLHVGAGVGCNAAIVLLLCLGGSGGGCLCLCVLLLQTVGVRLLMRVPLPVGRRVLVLVRKDVLLRGQHGCGGGFSRGFEV